MYYCTWRHEKHFGSWMKGKLQQMAEKPPRRVATGKTTGLTLSSGSGQVLPSSLGLSFLVCTRQEAGVSLLGKAQTCSLILILLSTRGMFLGVTFFELGFSHMWKGTTLHLSREVLKTNRGLALSWGRIGTKTKVVSSSQRSLELFHVWDLGTHTRGGLTTKLDLSQTVAVGKL